uniref:Protein PHLOEM PROTEIN 2-LIKE A9-like n=1 Tax=Populus trichocarpa TaxID=3694 RepID=A0A2K1YCG8_POPTR
MKMHARLSLKTENDGVIDGLEWFLCLQDTGRWRFKPRGLNITWSSNEHYWTMPEKGTDDPAELLKVCWLEINGSTPKPLSKGERYALSFKISMTEDTFGWQEAPAFMMAKVGKKGIAKWARINLADVQVDHEMEVPFGKLRFEVSKNAQDTTLYFGFYELWCGGWKGGLRIHEAVVEEMPD